MKRFGENLKRIRLERGWTQEEMANILHTSKQVISRYENGQRSPRVSVAADYADLLGVPVSKLMPEKEEGSQDDTRHTITMTSASYSVRPLPPGLTPISRIRPQRIRRAWPRRIWTETCCTSSSGLTCRTVPSPSC